MRKGRPQKRPTINKEGGAGHFVLKNASFSTCLSKVDEGKKKKKQSGFEVDDWTLEKKKKKKGSDSCQANEMRLTPIFRRRKMRPSTLLLLHFFSKRYSGKPLMWPSKKAPRT